MRTDLRKLLPMEAICYCLLFGHLKEWKQHVMQQLNNCGLIIHKARAWAVLYLTLFQFCSFFQCAFNNCSPIVTVNTVTVSTTMFITLHSKVNRCQALEKKKKQQPLDVYTLPSCSKVIYDKIITNIMRDDQSCLWNINRSKLCFLL